MNAEERQFWQLALCRRIFADVIVYIFPHLPYRIRGRLYELNAKVERAD